ncbi:hypothetical protein SEA_RUTHIEJR_85 [Mycobacterium phage Ruthiejr]|nr:hypothetical protein SEA_RUTHIEJR_85 [Mycobacterium phage Ruthiejr]
MTDTSAVNALLSAKLRPQSTAELARSASTRTAAAVAIRSS